MSTYDGVVLGLLLLLFVMNVYLTLHDYHPKWVKRLKKRLGVGRFRRRNNG